MRIAKYEDDHYQFLIKTWSKHGWVDLVPRDFLPKVGFVALEEDRFIAALFAYIEPGTIAYVAWPTGAFDATDAERSEAFKNLFEVLKAYAITQGCNFMYGATAVDAYKKLMEGWGFIPTEGNLKSYLYPLNDVSADFLKD
jgi:hypothetical protein